MSNKNKKEKNILGHKQSDFAGTNTDKYGDPKPANQQNNPIQNDEAQNIKEGDRMTGKEAEHARNKANAGARQGRNK
jgi:hypothetical protein